MNQLRRDDLHGTEPLELRDDRICGTVDSNEVALDGNEIVSMNFWAFLPAIFPLLRAEFLQFLKSNGEDTDAEFLIPEAVNSIIASGQARFKMLPARGPGTDRVRANFGKPHSGAIRKAV